MLLILILTGCATAALTNSCVLHFKVDTRLSARGTALYGLKLYSIKTY